MWSQEQGIESIAQERSDRTWNGSGAKERRTSGIMMSFRDALERHGAKAKGQNDGRSEGQNEGQSELSNATGKA